METRNLCNKVGFINSTRTLVLYDCALPCPYLSQKFVCLENNQ